jgi:formamidopyrimidine-DNA glycosylase
MPELPNITIYIDALKPRIQGTALTGLRLKCPFLQRTVPP